MYSNNVQNENTKATSFQGFVECIDELNSIIAVKL